jgi:hypothetical protein
MCVCVCGCVYLRANARIYVFRGFQKCFEARHVLSKTSFPLAIYVIIFSIGNDDDDDISRG